MRQAVLDSRLAILQRTPLENLGMFDDQQSLCDWAHDAIALHPFTTPGEGEREAAHPFSTSPEQGSVGCGAPKRSLCVGYFSQRWSRG